MCFRRGPQSDETEYCASNGNCGDHRGSDWMSFEPMQVTVMLMTMVDVMAMMLMMLMMVSI